MITRRTFLKLIGVGGAAAIATPLLSQAKERIAIADIDHGAAKTFLRCSPAREERSSVFTAPPPKR